MSVVTTKVARLAACQDRGLIGGAGQSLRHGRRAVEQDTTYVAMDVSKERGLRAIAWKAQVRLCGRYRRMQRAGRPVNVLTVAIARELAAFVWAIATKVALRPTAS